MISETVQQFDNTTDMYNFAMYFTKLKNLKNKNSNRK